MQYVSLYFVDSPHALRQRAGSRCTTHFLSWHRVPATGKSTPSVRKTDLSLRMLVIRVCLLRPPVSRAAHLAFPRTPSIRPPLCADRPLVPPGGRPMVTSSGAACCVIEMDHFHLPGCIVRGAYVPHYIFKFTRSHIAPIFPRPTLSLAPNSAGRCSVSAPVSHKCCNSGALRHRIP